MPLKRYCVVNDDPGLHHRNLVSPVLGTAAAVVGLRIFGGPSGGTLHIEIWQTSPTAKLSDTAYTVAANDVLFIDCKEFIEYGQAMTIEGDLGMAVSASCVIMTTPAPEPRLPEGYTEVKCIKLGSMDYAGQHNKQAVITPVVPSATQSYECVFAVDERYSGTSGTMCVFGGKSAHTSGLGAALWLNPSGGSLNFVFGGPDGETTYQGVGITPYGTYVTATSDMATGVFKVDGVTLATVTPQTMTATPAKIALFCQHNASGAGWTSTAPVKIKSFRAWDGSTLLCDQVPCLRDSDSRPGMYDLIANAYNTSTLSSNAFLDYESL